jgi:putative transposase
VGGGEERSLSQAELPLNIHPMAIGAPALFDLLPRKLDRSELEFSAVFSPGWEERKTMKASQFSDAQKAFILKQGNDGIPVADICRKAGISQATYFNWKKKYEGMLPPEMRRLKQLEDENAKLKKIVADLSLDREILQDVIRRKI